MELITIAERQRLIENGRKLVQNPNRDLMPVVMLVSRWLQCRWLLASIDPGYPNIAYGLIDLDGGCPELGPVSLTELGVLHESGFNVPLIERDLFFTANKSLVEYANDALSQGHLAA